MDASELIKKTFVEATNNYAVMHGIEPPFTLDDLRSQPACNIEAIEAYKANQGLPPGLYAIMCEKFAKAALADEMLSSLKRCSNRLNYIFDVNQLEVAYGETCAAANEAMAIIKKYEALPK